jgi:uncharacterized protein YbcV (DUF1398 family)
MPTLSKTIADAQTFAASIRPKVGGFPHLAEVLRRAGVASVHVVVPSMTSTYVTSGGDLVEQGDPQVSGPTSLPPFDDKAVVAAIRADQAGEITYPEFMARLWTAGVLTYDVDMAARTCTYWSARGESYTERYAAVEVSESTGRVGRR